MRVGRPVKALPQPICSYCGQNAALARAGDETYPYREDHGPIWICTACQAWIGVHSRSTRNVPLGRLADAALREAKSQLHDALEPLIAAKVRRDAVNPFSARAKAYIPQVEDTIWREFRCQSGGRMPIQGRRVA